MDSTDFDEPITLQEYKRRKLSNSNNVENLEPNTQRSDDVFKRPFDVKTYNNDSDSILSISASMKPANNTLISGLLNPIQSLALPKIKMVTHKAFWQEQMNDSLNAISFKNKDNPIRIMCWSPMLLISNKLAFTGLTAGNRTVKFTDIQHRFSRSQLADCNGVVYCLYGPMYPKKNLPPYVQNKFVGGVPEDWVHVCQKWAQFLDHGCPPNFNWTSLNSSLASDVTFIEKQPAVLRSGNDGVVNLGTYECPPSTRFSSSSSNKTLDSTTLKKKINKLQSMLKITLLRESMYGEQNMSTAESISTFNDDRFLKDTFNVLNGRSNSTPMKTVEQLDFNGTPIITQHCNPRKTVELAVNGTPISTQHCNPRKTVEQVAVKGTPISAQHCNPRKPVEQLAVNGTVISTQHNPRKTVEQVAVNGTAISAQHYNPRNTVEQLPIVKATTKISNKASSISENVASGNPPENSAKTTPTNISEKNVSQIITRSQRRKPLRYNEQDVASVRQNVHKAIKSPENATLNIHQNDQVESSTEKRQLNNKKSTGRKSSSNVVVLENWSLIIKNVGHEITLRVKGQATSLGVNNYVSGDIIKRISNKRIEDEDGVTFVLEGELCDTDNKLPDFLRKYFQRGVCANWKKILKEHFNSSTSDSKSARLPARNSSRFTQSLDRTRSNADNSISNLDLTVSKRGRTIVPTLNYWTGERLSIKPGNHTFVDRSLVVHVSETSNTCTPKTPRRNLTNTFNSLSTTKKTKNNNHNTNGPAVKLIPLNISNINKFPPDDQKIIKRVLVKKNKLNNKRTPNKQKTPLRKLDMNRSTHSGCRSGKRKSMSAKRNGFNMSMLKNCRNRIWNGRVQKSKNSTVKKSLHKVSVGNKFLTDVFSIVKPKKSLQNASSRSSVFNSTISSKYQDVLNGTYIPQKRKLFTGNNITDTIPEWEPRALNETVQPNNAIKPPTYIMEWSEKLLSATEDEMSEVSFLVSRSNSNNA